MLTPPEYEHAVRHMTQLADALERHKFCVALKQVKDARADLFYVLRWLAQCCTEELNT